MSRKSVQLEPRWYMWTDGRMDMTELIDVFRYCTNAPKSTNFTEKLQIILYKN